MNSGLMIIFLQVDHCHMVDSSLYLSLGKPVGTRFSSSHNSGKPTPSVHLYLGWI